MYNGYDHRQAWTDKIAEARCSNPLWFTLLVCDSCGKVYGCWFSDNKIENIRICGKCEMNGDCKWQDEEIEPNGTCINCWSPIAWERYCFIAEKLAEYDV